MYFYIPLTLFIIGTLFPFYWMLITSIKPNRELYSQKIMPLVVHQPTLKHYVDLLTETNFLTWTYNTMLVACVTTLVSVVLGTMIAYPLARMRFPGAAVVAMLPDDMVMVAAARAIAHPMRFILTPKNGLQEGPPRRACPGNRRPYRRRSRSPQGR